MVNVCFSRKNIQDPPVDNSIRFPVFEVFLKKEKGADDHEGTKNPKGEESYDHEKRSAAKPQPKLRTTEYTEHTEF